MADNPEVSTAELLSRTKRGWDSLQAYIKSLTPEQLTVPTDPAGWTVKDHLIHLAVWEDGIVAVLEGADRLERMGVTPETWATDDFDIINAVIQQRHRDMSLDAVLQTLADVHQRLVARIAALSDADLLRPYKYFAPASTSEGAIIWSIVGNSYGHYAEHIPWMDTIVYGAQHEILSKVELLAGIDSEWDRLNAYIDSLTEAQLTQPSDPAGWTAKDHLAHLAVWEESLNALLDRQPRRERMGIDQATWDSGDIDAINAVIQQRYHDTPLADVRKMLNDTHEQLLAKLKPLYDSDLQLPYSCYQSGSIQERPAILYLVGDLVRALRRTSALDSGDCRRRGGGIVQEWRDDERSGFDDQSRAARRHSCGLGRLPRLPRFADRRATHPAN
ncbi:MAG: ClbS/DfsB family four-helix bundle protein [Anaerolineae bacterium]